jgi:DnaJ-class molecular chaperone
MERISEETIIYVTKYKAKDGKVFDTESACRAHESFLDGTRKFCEYCNGKGYVSHGYHSVLNELTYQYEQVEYTEKCPKCNGKGYLEKKTVWE